MGKSGVLSSPSRKVKTAEGLSRNDLCALGFLSVHPFVSVPEDRKIKRSSYP